MKDVTIKYGESQAIFMRFSHMFANKEIHIFTTCP